MQMIPYPKVNPLINAYHNDPMLRYYRTEYKADWEYLYLRHLEEVSLERKLRNVLSKIYKKFIAKSSEPVANQQTHALVA